MACVEAAEREREHLDKNDGVLATPAGPSDSLRSWELAERRLAARSLSHYLPLSLSALSLSSLSVSLCTVCLWLPLPNKEMM